ncbi:CIC11C00000004265 [Sungouiella intermedia]|uniref:CIC11C00000004265 n=1 Tax=Sungouiella intermedia TaxID=45354 RepID=A0A1L0D9E3_9ASCO|nr:CIC11C00000004265 [[Candida] intermedia]
MTSPGPDQEVEPKPKSSLQKDENHLLRQEQIQLYKSTVLKEERERRMKIRHGKFDESPKKKKRVSFELSRESIEKRTPENSDRRCNEEESRNRDKVDIDDIEDKGDGKRHTNANYDKDNNGSGEVRRNETFEVTSETDSYKDNDSDLVLISFKQSKRTSIK